MFEIALTLVLVFATMILWDYYKRYYENTNGDKHWYNKQGQLHREDGPAVERADGYKAWYKNGKLHREDGPAVEWSNGGKTWYQNNIRHRLDGPAVERWDGRTEYWVKGVKYTEKDFTKKFGEVKKVQKNPVINKYGDAYWYNEKGQRHREDGPAVEYISGGKAWYKNGQLHREDGPAVEEASGYKAWFKNGKYHRLGGPAIEYADGYYVEGIKYLDFTKKFEEMGDK